MAEQSETMVMRVVRAPFFVVPLLLSMLPLFFIFASVSVGAWIEQLMFLAGFQAPPRWLPGALGMLSYTGLGIAGPAVLGNTLLGWPGAVLGPLLVLGLIAKLGRW